MPCLTNLIPLHQPPNQQKKHFFKLIVSLAEQYSEAMDYEEEQKIILNKIDELRTEIYKLKILTREDLWDLQYIFNENFLFYSDEYIQGFINPQPLLHGYCESLDSADEN